LDFLLDVTDGLPRHARFLRQHVQELNCFTLALILTFSPGKKERLLRVSLFRQAVRPIQSREFSSRRRTVLLLLGEKAGMREVVKQKRLVAPKCIKRQD
jgi:hypothetical protein